MTDHLELARLITTARRTHGLTQSEIAKQVGCRQSAVSMFERGHANALARPKVDALLKLLDIERSATGELTEGDHPSKVASQTPTPSYCPVFDCPSNIPFTVQDTLLIKPHTKPPADARHCAFCGELLEAACPECGVPFNSSACCVQCGTAYISTPPRDDDAMSTRAWADSQRNRLRELGLLR